MSEISIDTVGALLGFERARQIETYLEHFRLTRNIPKEEFIRDYTLVEQGEPLIFENGTVRVNRNWRIVRKDELDNS